MSDKELIERTAMMWVSCGGDAEGIEWCWRQLRDEVARITEAAE